MCGKQTWHFPHFKGQFQPLRSLLPHRGQEDWSYDKGQKKNQKAKYNVCRWHKRLNNPLCHPPQCMALWASHQGRMGRPNRKWQARNRAAAKYHWNLSLWSCLTRDSGRCQVMLGRQGGDAFEAKNEPLMILHLRWTSPSSGRQVEVLSALTGSHPLFVRRPTTPQSSGHGCFLQGFRNQGLDDARDLTVSCADLFPCMGHSVGHVTNSHRGCRLQGKYLLWLAQQKSPWNCRNSSSISYFPDVTIILEACCPPLLA